MKLGLVFHCMLLLLIAFFFGSVFTPRAQFVKTDCHTQTYFTKFKTYSLLAPGESVLNRKRIDKVYGGTITIAPNQKLKNRERYPCPEIFQVQHRNQKNRCRGIEEKKVKMSDDIRKLLDGNHHQEKIAPDRV